MTNPYGPWATAIDPGRNPQLSAFWRQRLAMLVPTSRTSLTVARRSVVSLVAAAVFVFLLPTIRPAPIAAQQQPSANINAPQVRHASPATAVAGTDSRSRQADDTEAAERLWSARYKLVNDTPCYLPPDMDIFFLPFHLGNHLGGLAELNLSGAQKEKLRQICGEYMKQKHEAHLAVVKDWENLSPAQRDAKSKKIQADYIALDRTFGKRLNEVLTPEQQAKVRRAMLQNEAAVDLMLIMRSARMDENLHLDLSDGQRRQLSKLFSDRDKQQAQGFRYFPDKLLEVLTPQQREKLLQGIDDKAPTVYVPPLPDASSQVIYSGGTLGSSPNPFAFWFNSSGDARVDVYAESGLSDGTTRKQLRLSDAQEAKLRAIHVATQAAADVLFKAYDLDYDALKKLPAEAQQKKRADYEAKRGEFRRKLTDFGDNTRRQIEAVLDAEQLAAIRKSIRTTRAVMALMSPDRKTRDSISATGQQRAKLLDLGDEQRDPSRFERQTGEEALKILTPQQRQKLVESLERQGG